MKSFKKRILSGVLAVATMASMASAMGASAITYLVDADTSNTQNVSINNSADTLSIYAKDIINPYINKTYWGKTSQSFKLKPGQCTMVETAQGNYMFVTSPTSVRAHYTGSRRLYDADIVLETGSAKASGIEYEITRRGTSYSYTDTISNGTLYQGKKITIDRLVPGSSYSIRIRTYKDFDVAFNLAGSRNYNERVYSDWVDAGYISTKPMNGH